MDYEELNLRSGDILTAQHVAHIEAGIDFATAEIDKIKNARIVLRNDTSANWAESNLILLRGEPAAEFAENNTVKFKIGDGINTWANLPCPADQALADAKSYADGAVAAAIERLDYTDTEESGKFVTGINMADGELTVTRTAINIKDLAQTADTYIVFDCGTATINI